MNFDDFYSWMFKLGIFTASVVGTDALIRALRRYFINKGREEAFAEMEEKGWCNDNGNIYVKRAEDGERAVLCVNGQEFYLNLEPVKK